MPGTVGRLAPLLIASGLLLLTAQPAAATAPSLSSVAAARARQAALAQVRAQLGDAIAGNLAAQDQLTQAIAENQRQSALLAGQLADANRKLGDLEAQLAAIADRQSALEVEIAGERRQLDGLARALYVQPDTVLMQLAQAGSLGEAISRVAALQSAAQRAEAVQRRLTSDQAELAAARKKADSDRAQQAQVRDGLLAKTQRLQQLQDQQTAALADLQARLESSRSELSAVNVQSSTTAEYIAAALAAEQATASSAAYQAVWEQVQLLGDDGPGGGAPAFANPLPGAELTQPYGPTTFVFEPPYAGFAHFHTGVDVSTAAGTPVLAAASGVVLLAGYNPGGYGNYVVVGHAGGFDTLYGHLAAIAVRTGQTVAAGDPIGAEGSTGNSTGPHLHFEVRRSGQPVDPAAYVRLG